VGVVLGTGGVGLLEREAELALANRLLGRAVAGTGAVVVVEGPPGIGKSELLSAMREAAGRRGFASIVARGSEFESEIPFGVARALFEPMLGAASAWEGRRLLDGVARVGARALGVVEGEPPADRFAAIHGLFWLCANQAERSPLIVVVDDVQWADDPSLAWLGYLARRVGDLRLVVMLGLRSGDPGGGRSELVQLLGDDPVRRIAPAPLTAHAVGTIVRSQLDQDADESFCAAVGELSGGNPFFVREALAAARENGLPAREGSVPALELLASAAVSTPVVARVGRLGDEALAVARAVAVLGAGAEVALAAQLGGLDPLVAELTADRLAAAHILAPVRPLEFRHPLIGAAISDDIAPGARRVAHRRAATLLDRDGQGQLARVAAHLLACGPAGDRWVIQRLRDAALDALDRGAPQIAATYLRRALLEPPEVGERAALLFLYGSAAWRAGQPDAIALLEETLAAAGHDHRSMIAACALLALAYNVTDRAERAVEVLERALAAVGDQNKTLAVTSRLGELEPEALRDARLALTLEASAAGVGLMNERTAPVALRRAEALRGRLHELADPPVYLLAMLAYYAARANRAAEAHNLLERALACEPYPPPLDICPLLIFTLTLVERYEECQRLCEDLLVIARGRGALQETIGVLVLRASASYDCGALADAEADARWALEWAAGIRRIQAGVEVVRVLVERDELDAAEDMLEQCPDPRATNAAEVVRFLIARGQLRGAQGRLAEAVDDFLECGRRCARLGRLELSAVTWRAEAALVYAALGDTEKARRLAGEQLALARASGRPRTLGISLRACGLIEGGEAGLELLGEAVKTLERSQSPLELGRALSDYGAALRRAGRRVHARAVLERALDLAHHCGARRLANQARAELIAAGAKPRRDAITGRDALTAGEFRVARLAADGLTNREIAQALFITTKTAKAHLNRVYRKLEITRREQLADALSGVLHDGRKDPAASLPLRGGWGGGE
jgi:DNA-binding CsgD family transcriptional regulator